jgi:hypothetical protein
LITLDVFLGQLPALLGVVVGAIITFVLAFAGERTRWRRDQRVRWDTVRLQAYADYGEAVRRVAHLASRMAVARGFEHPSEPISLEQGLSELNVAMADRATRWETVLLLGSPDTIAAARAWHRCVDQYAFFARGLLSDPEEWKQAYDEFVRSRAAFYRSARDDLGVDGLDLPPTSWPPRWYQRMTPEQRAAMEAVTESRRQRNDGGP